MNKRLVRTVGGLAVVFGVAGCAANPSMPAQSAARRSVSDVNHECRGNSCGPKALMSEWTLAVGDQGVPFRGSECLGTVCGPGQGQTTWVLKTPSEWGCLGTVCGPEIIDVVIGPVGVEQVASRSQSRPR